MVQRVGFYMKHVTFLDTGACRKAVLISSDRQSMDIQFVMAISARIAVKHTVGTKVLKELNP